MEPTATHLSSYDQSPTISTMVGPLFKRPRHGNVHIGDTNNIFDCGTRIPADSSFEPSSFSPALFKPCVSSTRVIASGPTKSILEESVRTALQNTSSGYDSNIDDTHLSTKLRRLRTARRREQCRVNQARYRLKQDRNIFNVVVEYFHLFRHGIRVNLGDRRGVDVLIELWRRYTTYFDDLHFQLEHMEERLKNLVAVSASMSVTITETTLKRVFPHLVGTAQGEKLLGRRLMLPCELWFEWNDARGYIVRLELSVDFLMPVSRVLNSLKDAAFVLAQALITCDGSIGKFDL
ncbi:Hypothetical protein PHPALM_17717 [Phytophthora palmivora]|uniref:Bzip transcription factor n=1 Tax=Phytophthora palmivora TaxID=4796 RepID=A0A2P4XLJ0_9STRA|nr:Hypothetical protein PHPALM_17717 [Phytophthora palmivora]